MNNKLDPKISVVIPTYNEACFLPRSINSVLNQTYKNIEVIVVNDGSSDDTESVVNSFSDTGRVKLINQVNSGVSRARNNGVENSSGELIAFIDSDDYWLKDKLEKQIEVYNAHNDLVLITAAERLVDVNENLISSPPLKIRCFDKPCNYRDHFLYGNSSIGFSPTSWMMPKMIFNQLGGFKEGIISEDYEFLIRLTEIGDFYVISERLVDYTVRSNSLIRSDMSREYLSLIHVISLHREKYNFVQYRKRLFTVYYEWSKARVFANDKNALNTVVRCFLYNPFDYRAYVLLAKAVIKKALIRG